MQTRGYSLREVRWPRGVDNTVFLYLYLFWWGGHCCPMHYDLFDIYCAAPNLGITRTWICRLNFAQRPIFSGLKIFNEPETSDSGSPADDLCSGFYWKIPSTSAGFEPANLGSRGEHVTPRPTDNTVRLSQWHW